jgi:hypothetical protein
MYAFSAGQQGKGFQSGAGEHIAHLAGSLAHRAEFEGRIRIKVDHQTVRILQPVGARSPEMQFDHAHLGRGNERFGGLEKDVVGLLSVALPDADLAEFFQRRGAGMFLEEAITGEPRRTAHEADRMV